MQDVIRFDHVKRVYRDGRFTALDDVSLGVRKGEFLVVMGRSGSGKSTLLHLMGLLDSPTEGHIYVDGVDTAGLSAEELARLRRQKVGFVFQTFNLVPNIDAVANVALPMMFAGVGKRLREKKATWLLGSLGLGDKLRSYPNEMSGGERQRVATARALANDPEVILADEPTGNLDSASAKQVLDVFGRLHDTGRKTIVVVTHEEYVAALGERIVYLKDGRISPDGKLRGR